jgi:hypothetical protein
MNLEAMKKQMLAKAAVKRENAQLKANTAGKNKLAPLDQSRVLVTLEQMAMVQVLERDLQLTEEGSPEYQMFKIALSEAWNNIKSSTPKGTAEHSHIYYTIFQSYPSKVWFDDKSPQAYEARIAFLAQWHDTIELALERKEAATYTVDEDEDSGEDEELDAHEKLHRMKASEDIHNTGLTWDAYEDEISERTSEVASMFTALVVPDIVNF